MKTFYNVSMDLIDEFKNSKIFANLFLDRKLNFQEQNMK